MYVEEAECLAKKSCLYPWVSRIGCYACATCRHHCYYGHQGLTSYIRALHRQIDNSCNFKEFKNLAAQDELIKAVDCLEAITEKKRQRFARRERARKRSRSNRKSLLCDESISDDDELFNFS